MNYYEVKAKCGHVKRGHYIIKSFYICADKACEAAEKTRYIARVKHNQKDAIREVKQISEDEYNKGRIKNNSDMYFQVDNSSDARIYCENWYDEIQKEEEKITYKKNKHERRRLIDEYLFKNYRLMEELCYE